MLVSPVKRQVWRSLYERPQNPPASAVGSTSNATDPRLEHAQRHRRPMDHRRPSTQGQLVTLVYVFGEPGVGKSTACAAALAPYTAVPQPDARCPHLAYYTSRGRLAALQLGLDHPDHPGTDRLSMAILPDARAWISTVHPDIPILGEGDRLATPRFWYAATDAGHTLTLVHLWADPATHKARITGRNQNPTWLKGRATLTRNLSLAHPHHLIRADDDAPAQLAHHLGLPTP